MFLPNKAHGGKVSRFGTPPTLTEYQARCIAADEGDWKAITNLKAHREVAVRLEHELRDMNVVCAYITKDGEGSGRVVEQGFFSEIYSLPHNLPLYRNPVEGADAVWLGRRQAFVDLINTRLLFLARGKNFFLAGRYTTNSGQIIANAFNTRGVDARGIAVNVFFDSPTKDSRQLKQFKNACKVYGISNVTHDYPLPADGAYPYAGHSNPELASLHGLGIVMRT